MKIRLIPLGLAASLALTLAACTGGETVESVPPSESAPATEAAVEVTETPAPSDADPSESAAPSDSAVPAPDPTPDAPNETPSETPSEAPIPDKGTPPPAWTHHPDDHHTVATPAPTPAWTHHPDDHHTVTAPAATPSPTPAPSETPAAEPSEPPQEVTAASVYAAVSEAAGVSYDDVAPYLEAYYPSLDTGDLADYVFYQPSMSGQIEEIFIAKVNSGKMDAVKSACMDRQQGMAEDAEEYPATGTYVGSYQLVTQGDWLLFCVGPNPQGAVTAFQNAVK